MVYELIVQPLINQALPKTAANAVSSHLEAQLTPVLNNAVAPPHPMPVTNGHAPPPLRYSMNSDPGVPVPPVAWNRSAR